MKTLKVESFRELMNGNESAEISCLYSGKTVRFLKVEGDDVVIDPNEKGKSEHPVISVSLDTPITYTPWVFDRGNLNFEHSKFPEGAKICGEADNIAFPSGEVFSVVPKI